MEKLRRSIGAVMLAGLVCVAIGDIGSYFGWTPVITAADKKFTVFAYYGTLSIEWAGDIRVANLSSMGHPLWQLNVDSNDWPYVAFSHNGRHVALELIELPLVIGSVGLLLGPMWVGRIRRFEGRCPRCDYQVIEISSSRCPECGEPISGDTMRELANVKSSRFSYRTRRLVFPYLIAISTWILFRVILHLCTPSRLDGFYAI